MTRKPMKAGSERWNANCAGLVWFLRLGPVI